MMRPLFTLLLLSILVLPIQAQIALEAGPTLGVEYFNFEADQGPLSQSFSQGQVNGRFGGFIGIDIQRKYKFRIGIERFTRRADFDYAYSTFYDPNPIILVVAPEISVNDPALDCNTFVAGQRTYVDLPLLATINVWSKQSFNLHALLSASLRYRTHLKRTITPKDDNYNQLHSNYSIRPWRRTGSIPWQVGLLAEKELNKHFHLNLSLVFRTDSYRLEQNAVGANLSLVYRVD